MEFKKIKLIDGNLPKKKRWVFPKGVKIVIGVLGTLVLLLIGLYIYSYSSPNSTVSIAFRNVLPGYPIKTTDDRVNILMIGNAGGKHDGPLLTDSIIVASYNLRTNNVVLFSIPRDLWLGELKAKVNTAYEIGERDKNGLKFAEDKIDNILGIPIHYGIRIDFGGFEKAIDLVGGIEVDVPKTFDDYNYPISGKEDDLCENEEKEVDITEEMSKNLKLPAGKAKLIFTKEGKVASEAADFACRFERLHFNAGKQGMDGETALKFVRSRMGTNGEGSDFARSRRQQIVIQAFREKILSLQTLSSFSKIKGLIDTFGESFETDIPVDRLIFFANLARKVERIESVVLGDLGDGKSLFINPPSSQYGAWVLVPPEEDWSMVADFVRKALDKEKEQEKR